MEYVQMTLGDWMEMKQKLKQELLGVKQSFVRIGYALRKIEDQRLYEQDGYKSIAEFAKAEYGLEPSTTSRFMSINKEYSIDGYSEHLRPEYADLGRSQLEEMLRLPDSDRQMIQPETSREDIRNLKRFNREEPAAGVADDIHQLVEKFYKDNPEVLNAVFSEPGFEEQTIKRFAEIVNPGGNRSYKKGLYFLMMYEGRVAVKKFGDTPQDMTWWEFYLITMDIFGQAAAGPKTWQKYFGKEKATESESEENGGEHSTDNSGDGFERNVSKDDAKPAERAGGEEEDSSGSGLGDRSDNIQPISAAEIDSGAVGESASEKTEDDTAGEESNEIDSQESAAETVESEGAENPKKEIAPAQKAAETLSGPEFSELEKPAEELAEIEERKPICRKEYMDTLTAYGAAEYMGRFIRASGPDLSQMTNNSFWQKWFLTEVDENGRKIIDDVQEEIENQMKISDYLE